MQVEEAVNSNYFPKTVFRYSLAVATTWQFHFSQGMLLDNPSTMIGSSSIIITRYIIYPFMAPAVNPLMIFFCRKIYTNRTGRTMSVTEEAISPKSVPYWELIVSKRLDIGYFVLSRIMIFCTNRSL